MKIVFAASEAVPFCKTGGLADVVGALSGALAQQGHQVDVFLPFYKDLFQKPAALQKPFIKIPMVFRGGIPVFTLRKTTVQKNLNFYFIDFPVYFGRPGLYGYQGKDGDFVDNAFRFGFFSKAVLESLKALGKPPDILHVHDWQTGALPVFLKTTYAQDPFFKKARSLMTIHNMGYLGWANAWTLPPMGITGTKGRLAYQGDVSLLRGGIQFADWVNTVSPTYKKEISSTAQFGHGLQKDLRQKGKRFVGILNGIDLDLWNPKKDKALLKRFDLKNLTDREKNRKKLGQLFKRKGFNGVMAGFVGRLDYQKGIEFILEAIRRSGKEGIRFVLLGSGSPVYQKKIERLVRRYPGRVYYESRFSDSLARLIYGGSDVFLMPSRFEPCGLGQLIAMRYGAIPVVTPTGGLKDTVIPYPQKNATGFISSAQTSASFYAAFLKAVRLVKETETWKRIQGNAMKKNFGWEKSVVDYARLYQKAVREKKGA